MSAPHAPTSAVWPQNPYSMPKSLSHSFDPFFNQITHTWLSQKHIPPVFMLTGIWGIGKTALALQLAQHIICQNNPLQKDLNQEMSFGFTAKEDQSLPCGQCVTCKNFLNDSFVDLIWIGKDLDEAQNNFSLIKLEDLEPITMALGHSGFSQNYKIILLPEAQNLTPQAANSLLKTLEEPPKNWIFILTSSEPHLVLPTLWSRCSVFKVPPHSPKTLYHFLRDHHASEERAKLATALSLGSAKRALRLTSEHFEEIRPWVSELLKCPSSSIAKLVEISSVSTQTAEQLLDQLELILHDLIMRSQLANYPFKNYDLINEITAHFNNCIKKQGLQKALSNWLTGLETVLETRMGLMLPLNRKLNLQSSLLYWLTIQ